MSKGTDRTFDLALALAASIAANGIVAIATTANVAAKYAKPAGRLAGKIGDRLLGGSPFNEREAQRFLTIGGSERLDRAEEANEVLDPFWADGGPTEWLPGFPADGRVIFTPVLSDDPFTSNPAGAAASEAGTGGAQDAPGVQPPVEQAPGPAQTSPSCAGLGAPTWDHGTWKLGFLSGIEHSITVIAAEEIRLADLSRDRRKTNCNESANRLDYARMVLDKLAAWLQSELDK